MDAAKGANIALRLVKSTAKIGTSFSNEKVCLLRLVLSTLLIYDLAPFEPYVADWRGSAMPQDSQGQRSKLA